MSKYQRLFIPGGTSFFTVYLADRSARTLVERVDLLRAAYNKVASAHPVICHAMVVLPDHLHAVWTLPDGDADLSIRWQKIKTDFLSHLPASESLNPSKTRKGEKGIWQRRFWGHAIRNSADFHRHVDYCHYDPVRHGLVRQPEDWEHSTIHRAPSSDMIVA